MTDDGDFKKVSTEVKISMLSSDFYQKLFEFPVQAVYQNGKKIVYRWDNKKTVFANKKEKGILFFFKKQD